MMSLRVKECFTREVQKKESDLNLAYAALLMAEYLTGPFDTGLCLSTLDEMAEMIEPALHRAESDEAMIKALNRCFFKELKFSGNIKHYYHPHNSYLNKVLELRLGIPISLSVVYLEVGWRLGLPLWGINLPGHFIVGYGPETEAIYIDVFAEGRLLSELDCLSLTQGRIASPQQLKTRYLKPTPKKRILLRMLLNLKQIYVNLEDWESGYRVVDLMLTVEPGQTNEYRDRGLMAYRLNQLRAASQDIERYLFLTPQSPDAGWLKQHLETIEERLLRLN
jgi:regulator of sirC expression with transglutaminase-like and TPR domain